jgi:hypothetical protein
MEYSADSQALDLRLKNFYLKAGFGACL